MLVPLVVLSVGAVAAGFAFYKQFVGEKQEEFWKGAIFTGPENHVLEHAHHVPEWVLWAPTVASLIGLAVAIWAYLLKRGVGARIAANGGPLYTFFYNKWFFDELYDLVFVKGARWLGDVFWKRGDQGTIDKLGPDGVAGVAYASGRNLVKSQTGFLYHYAFVMLLGVAGLLTYALFAFGAAG
jgi:NADH-quinone oxidoreductase subunit L